jgi:hypothetical protein
LFILSSRRRAALESSEQREAAPVVDECFEPVVFDALGEGGIPAPPPLAGFFLQAGMGADGQQREDALRAPGCDVEREPPAHGVADEVRAGNIQVVPQHHEVAGAGVHAARGVRRGPRLAVAAEVGHDPHVTCGHPRNDLQPAPAALREPVEQRDRRPFAADEVAQSHVRTLENHRHSMLWM